MTRILNQKCYKLLNPKTTEIIKKVQQNKTGLSQSCLKTFGVKSKNTKKHTMTKKNENKNENKNEKKNENTFLDFQYFYKKYFLENSITYLKNSIVISMIDHERNVSIFIKFDNLNTFKYNDYVYTITFEIENKNNTDQVLKNNLATFSSTANFSTRNINTNRNNTEENFSYINFLYDGHLLTIDKDSLLIFIDNEKVHGIPKNSFEEFIPVISVINIPNKVLNSCGGVDIHEDNGKKYVPLYFNIINSKFFIRYWGSNLYIDNENFFILIENQPIYFNKNLNYIETPKKDRKDIPKENILDIYYDYPFKNIKNSLIFDPTNQDLSIINQTNHRFFNKIDIVTSGIMQYCIAFHNEKNGKNYLSIPSDADDNYEFHIAFKIKKEDYPKNILAKESIIIDKTTEVIDPPVDKNQIISIKDYYSSFQISKLLTLLEDPSSQYKIYFDILKNLFFINFYGMNLYFQQYTNNFIIFTQKYEFIFDKDLILIEKYSLTKQVSKKNLNNNILSQVNLRSLNTYSSSKKVNNSPSRSTVVAFPQFTPGRSVKKGEQDDPDDSIHYQITNN